MCDRWVNMSVTYELSGRKRSFMYQYIKICNTDYTEATERCPAANLMKLLHVAIFPSGYLTLLFTQMLVTITCDYICMWWALWGGWYRPLEAGREYNSSYRTEILKCHCPHHSWVFFLWPKYSQCYRHFHVGNKWPWHKIIHSFIHSFIHLFTFHKIFARLKQPIDIEIVQ
jgi:hypothetical protein